MNPLKAPSVKIGAARRPAGRPKTPAPRPPVPLEVSWSGKRVALSPLQGRLYRFLKEQRASRDGGLSSYATLCAEVWETRQAVPVSRLQLLVLAIRLKLPGFAETVWGEGYRWADPEPRCWRRLAAVQPSLVPQDTSVRRVVRWSGVQVVLTPGQACLFAVLRAAGSSGVSCSGLGDAVYANRPRPSSVVASVRVTVAGLRQLLPGFAETTEGGYRWSPPDPRCWEEDWKAPDYLPSRSRISKPPAGAGKGKRG